MTRGLLDFLDTDEARLGVGLLAAAGPTPQPMSFGQRLAMATQGLQAQKDADLKRQFVQSQIGENNSQAAARQAQMEQERVIQAYIAARLRPPQAGGAGPQVPSTQQAPVMIGAANSIPSNPSPTPVQAVSGAAGQGQGGFPFSLNDLTALTGMGAKQAPALFEQWKYATDGVKREAGNYYQNPVTGAVNYMPKLDVGMEISPGGTVRPVQGFASSNALIKGTEAGAVTGATEKAKLPYTLAADRAHQETQASLDMMRVKGEDDNEYWVPRLSMSGSGTSRTGQSGPEPVIGLGPGGRFVAGRNPVTQQSQIALNDNWIKNTYQPTLDSGRSAANTLSGIEAIRNIDLNTGWGSETKAIAAGILEGLGIAPGAAAMYAANAQKFQSVAMDKVNSELLLQKGVQAKDDAERAKATYVALRNTPEANQYILDYAQAKANMDQRKAQYYEAALPLGQKSGDLTRVDREWRKVAGSIWADPILQRWKK